MGYDGLECMLDILGCLNIWDHGFTQITFCVKFLSLDLTMNGIVKVVVRSVAFLTALCATGSSRLSFS